MPINYLQPVEIQTVAKSTAVEFIQKTLKQPFSIKVLALSLGLGITVALVVTVVLFGIRSLTKPEVNSAPNQLVAQAEADKVIAGATTIDVSKIDSDQDGIYDWAESTFGTDPFVRDTDFDGFDDSLEILHGFDPTGFGRPAVNIQIEKISLTAPVIFPTSQAEADMQLAMQQGVAHYPGTAAPGAPGNIYLTGHSSDYQWKDGNYKKVFRRLPELEAGDRVVIEQKLNSGHILKHTYNIYDKQVTAVNATALWQADREGSILTLVTSWPIDSTKERLMLRGSLVE